MKKQTAVDPVCGMQVDPATAKFTVEHEGTRYAFCCGCCMKAFKAEPTRNTAKPATSCCARKVVASEAIAFRD